MNAVQMQSKSISSLSRGKTVRQFGRDLTNCYNMEIASRETIKSTCFGFPQSSKSNIVLKSHNNENLGYNYGSETNFEINLMLDEAGYDPVNDHVNDIMAYTVSQSFISCLEQDYMRWHSQINEQMRQILINWLIKVQVQMKLQHSTLCLAVYLIDKFCYQQSINKSKYQLLGITCLFMAAKYEELATPRMSRFIDFCDRLYTKKNFIQMESQVLEAIGFNINKIVLLRELLFNRVGQIFKSHKNNNLINYMSDQSEGYSIEQSNVLTRCQYLIQISLLEYKFSLMQPHYLSAVLLYISCKKENIQMVNSKYIIQKYNLSQKIFKQYFQNFLSLLKRKNQYKFREINKKYQHLNNEY